MTLIFTFSLGALLRKEGKLAEAEELYRRTLDILSHVRDEEEFVTAPSRAALNGLLTTLGAQGKLEEARRYVGQEFSRLRRLAEGPRANATYLNAYAWYLLTCEPPELRDPETALPVAVKAVEVSRGKDAAILATLAVAYKITGDIDKAIETQRQALSLLPQQKMDPFPPWRYDYEIVLASQLRVETGAHL